jgi:hypothetical protein
LKLPSAHSNLSEKQLATLKPYHGKRMLVQGTFKRVQPVSSQLALLER